MGDLPQHDVVNLSLEAALYDSKSGRFSQTTAQPKENDGKKQAANSEQTMQQRPNS
ncbi:MAG: hypothetical protein KDA31_11535 [Phycisphaerales bacterium]|nr:hypothetical protein [Phycisphaerales bacterium]MCB9836161.1 hypothetical protein [Phycisphaera sp.]